MRERRVLLVEHEWRMRHFVRTNLEAAGMQVVPAVNGAHALQLLDQSQFDLVLVDLDEHRLDWAALRAAIQESAGAASAPVILMGHEVPAWQGGTNQAGLLFLEKPFGASELLQRVRQALAGLAPARTGDPPST